MTGIQRARIAELKADVERLREKAATSELHRRLYEAARRTLAAAQS